jgi:SH3-like domain-containing protein
MKRLQAVRSGRRESMSQAAGQEEAPMIAAPRASASLAAKLLNKYLAVVNKCEDTYLPITVFPEVQHARPYR